MFDSNFVVAVHDEILAETGGLPGFAGGGMGGVEAALQRIQNHMEYAGLDDVFGIASLYAEALARGHVFNDANKRTALTCALTFLAAQGIHIPSSPILEDATVALAEGTMSGQLFAVLLDLIAEPRITNSD